jgi:hypothetical protein
MVFCASSKPEINLLEWKCLNRNIWLGRLPRKEMKDRVTEDGGPGDKKRRGE